MLLELVPKTVRNILYLGTGDGRLLSLLKIDRKCYDYNLDDPLLHIVEGRFDVVVSSKAIHHLTHPRKRSLYAEIFDLLNDGGVFCNLDTNQTETGLK